MTLTILGKTAVNLTPRALHMLFFCKAIILSFLFLLQRLKTHPISNRNQDFQEVIVEVNGEPVLRFALAYGFRNIQNIVQKIKRKKLSYHFVEVMACPSGMYSATLLCLKRPLRKHLKKYSLVNNRRRGFNL